ncbi:hypothetical protein QO058_21055 [Bosea vestrisii]|uniref:hypothetical protein n=1 Tax=Bosea vestrisii TaxID=151416 RepID=UPI0024DF8CE9|nr:hypothetical protein [Bosea vestrisii]WID95254.1 hypothetical protein QO058_21055 [Bosea vestrisii]
MEDLHDRRYGQAKAFYERSLFIVEGVVWTAVREPVLSLRLWPKRAGVTLIPRPVVGAAHHQFSLARAAELTEFVRDKLGRQCGQLPAFYVVDSSALTQCDLVELAWDTLRIWAHPELDREALLDGPADSGTVEARILVRTAHKRLAAVAALEASGRQDRHPLTAKFLQRWEFELSFPHAQGMMTGDLVPSWTADEVPQEILDELATLSL